MDRRHRGGLVSAGTGKAGEKINEIARQRVSRAPLVMSTITLSVHEFERPGRAICPKTSFIPSQADRIVCHRFQLVLGLWRKLLLV